jgi:transcriptional regulator with XRE-family HTH domain
MKFGEKVKAQREKRGLSPKELAKAIEVSERTVFHYEQGQSHPQNREVYQRLSALFEMDVNYFLTEDEEFLTETARKYGRRGLSQGEAILEQASAFFAGGELSDDEKLAFLHEMQGLYLDSKERAKKFIPKKYRQEKNSDETD